MAETTANKSQDREHAPSRPKVWLARLLQCDEADITEDSSMQSHPHWDSMAHVQIMLYLEENYGVEMSEESIRNFASFSAIQALHNSRNSQ